MASNHTESYNLSQWEKFDKVVMEDFNADNAKIDAALKAEADARAGGIAAQADALAAEVQARTALAASLTSTTARAGNCQVYTQTYTGTGTYGPDNPKSLYFSYPPKLVIIVGPNGVFMIMAHGAPKAHFPTSSPPSYNIFITWSGNSVSWYGDHVNGHMNATGATYHVVALCSKS